MSVIEHEPQTLTEQAMASLKSFEPMVDNVLAYASFTVAEDGIGKVEEAHKAVKRLRSELEKTRKKLNEGALEYQRTVNATAKGLNEKIMAVEGRLGAEREAYEAEKNREKEAKEAEKIAAFQTRVDRLNAAGCPAGDLAGLRLMSDDEFEWHLAKESKAAEERGAELKRQAEEIAARQEELRIERERMEADRAEMRRQQEELQRHQAELRAKAEAEAAERRRIEREAEENRLAEELRLRIEALKPEIEKAEALAAAIHAKASDCLVAMGNPPWTEQALADIANCGRLIVAMVKRR